jgi:hypothetical protein
MTSKPSKSISVDEPPRFRDREAPGSNPGPPTNFSGRCGHISTTVGATRLSSPRKQ